jgi:hypothetical protein
MPAGSWIAGIQGITTALTSSLVATTRRGALKVAGGLSVFDDGTRTVLGGTQEITGSGTWDGKSAQVVVLGTGARTITVPNPDSTLQTRGFCLEIIDGAANAGTNNISIDPAGSAVINGSATTRLLTLSGDTARLKWLSTDVWIGTKGTVL